LRTQMTISKQVALFPVIQLEKLTGLYQKLFPLPGYHVSAYDQSIRAVGQKDIQAFFQIGH
ncbi:MAG: hypothetical protein WBI18_09580, partial [Candidatus Saccharicenans sp.]